MSTPIFDLEVTEDYQDMPILCEKDVYLMEAFVDSGFRNADLKALNFVRKYLQAVRSLYLILPLLTVVASLIIHMKDLKAMACARILYGRRYQRKIRCLSHLPSYRKLPSTSASLINLPAPQDVFKPV